MSMIGKTLGNFRIASGLGSGGMGEVYLANDQKLGRDVAIKVLPEEFAKDAERVARFQREAKLLASINHPNIAAIHGLEESRGIHFLVLELVEGDTLADRIRKGSIPLEESLKIALQIAEALEAAHEKGVIHRDLKPANIKVTPEGTVKVLDFGLAKAFAGEEGEVNLSHSPTLSNAATQQGVILGTASYMSPEQARGKPVDKRSDIWSFGCVLYECLTGRQIFRGEMVSDILAAVLLKEPDWAALPAHTPPRVRELLERCLTKDLKNRLRDIGDARQNLERTGKTGTSEAKVAGEAGPAVQTGFRQRRISLLPILASLVIGAAIGIAGYILWGGDAQSSTSRGSEVIRLSVTFPDYLRDVEGNISPDGRTMVIKGRPRNPEKPEDNTYRLYARQLDSPDWKLVPGSENGVSRFAFSPDSRRLAMTVRMDPSSIDYRLWMVLLDGSAPPQALINWADNWQESFVWLPDGALITITDNQEIVRIPLDGNPAEAPVPIRPDGFAGDVTLRNAGCGLVLPDGRHVLGTVPNWSEQGFRIDVAVFDVGSGDARIVLENAGFPRWSSTGHLLFSRGDTILAIPFDPVANDKTGGELAITDGLYVPEVWGHGWYDLAESGDMIHSAGGLVGQSRRLTWMNPDTFLATEPWSNDLRPYEGVLRVSPDRLHLAVQIPDSGGLFDCYLSEVEQPGLLRFIHEPGWDCYPGCFTPDSKELIYRLQAAPDMRLYRHRLDGTGDPELLLEEPISIMDSVIPSNFTPDGKYLILNYFRQSGSSELALLPLEAAPDGSRTPRHLLADARSGSVSPDGRLLLYQSEVSGKWEWYVCSISRDGNPGRPTQLTNDGGTMFWQKPARPDGNLNLSYAYKDRIYRVTITENPRLREVGRELIGEGDRNMISGDQFPDGRMLAVIRGEDEIDEHTSMTVVLNWTTELRRRLKQ